MGAGTVLETYAPVAGQRPIHDFGRALDRATGARAIPGNAVRHFAISADALGAIGELIDGARHRIHFENYIIRDDSTGQALSDRLIAAAARGVTVRVLYDRVGSFRTGRAFFRRLRDSGVEVRGFGRFRPLHAREYFTRDHRKYLAVDGRVAVMGGLCIGNEWAGVGRWEGTAWRDTVIEIRGPAVPALELTFGRVWARVGPPLPDAGTDRPVGTCGDAVVRVIEGVPGRFRVYRTVELLATAAVNRLWVAEAYLLPPQAMYATLLAAARDGVDVRLLLPGRSDLPPVAALSRVGYRELLAAGVRIWEWRGPMMHAKTVLADERWFKVGSSNLNATSLRHNHELDVLVEDPSLVRDAAAQFRLDVATSVEIVRRRTHHVLGLVTEALAAAPGPIADQRNESVAARSHRAVTSLRQVVAGARRSLSGAAVFGLLGAAALMVALPRTTAYLLAAVCLWAGVGAAWRYFEWRRQADD